MTKLINDKSYKENIKKCSAILKDLPNARDELVFWVNHILKFGGDHLRPVSADMGTLEFFMIDVIAFIGAVLGIISFIVYWCCCNLCRRCKRKLKTQ